MSNYMTLEAALVLSGSNKAKMHAKDGRLVIAHRLYTLDSSVFTIYSRTLYRVIQDGDVLYDYDSNEVDKCDRWVPLEWGFPREKK